MPREITPPRRFKTQIERIRDDAKAGGTAGGGQKLTVETVTAIQANGRVTVLGFDLSVTGDGTSLSVGQRVPVSWKAGQPEAVVFHHAQAAQFVPPLSGGDGIVEELYIDTNDGKLDIFFRNANIKTSFGMRSPNANGVTFLSADPLEVFWGANPDTFCVRTGTGSNLATHTYHVFKLHRTKDKVTASLPQVEQELYSQRIADVASFDMTRITMHIDRNASSEPLVELFWSPDNAEGPMHLDGPNAMRHDGNNRNDAHVTRAVTLALQGTTISFTNGSPIAANLIVNPDVSAVVTATIQGVMVDDNDELVYSVKVQFTNWGTWQGNSTTGLTGSYTLLGSGQLVNAGVCFVDGCPNLVDDVGIQDFMGHGNPSGVIATQINETHSIVVRARDATVLFSTFIGNATTDVEETSTGANPYRLMSYTGMPVINLQCYELPTWRSAPTLGTFTYPDIDVGLTGDVGLLKSERSLFSPSIPFAPDVPMGVDPTTPGSALTRCAIIRVNVPGAGYDQEWSDGFGNTCGVFSHTAPAAVRVLWNVNSVGVFERTRVSVEAFPYYAKGGQVYIFFSVFRQAMNPITYESDQSQYGVFVMAGGTTYTLQPYTNIPSTDTDRPVFMSGNQKRCMWRRGAAWYISDFAGHSAQVGSNADADDAAAMVLTENDFLYDTKDSRDYFVQAWNRSTLAITLNQSDPKFPPREGALAQVQALKKSTSDPGGPTLGHYSSWIIGTNGKRSFQTIMDKTLLPGAYKAL